MLMTPPEFLKVVFSDIFFPNNLSSIFLPFSFSLSPLPTLGTMGLDSGKKSNELFKEAISSAKTIVWNGPLGVFEFPNFANGTKVFNAVVLINNPKIPRNNALNGTHLPFHIIVCNG